MNKRKLLTLALTVAMIAILAIGGTLAYFTDNDYEKNVMTVGNVDIIQQEKDDDGSDFVDDQPLFPAPSDEYNSLNHIDKVVNVKNNGALPAYVRTILAFEDNEEGTITSQIHTLWGDVNGSGKLEDGADTNAHDDNDVVWMQNEDGSWMTVTFGEGADAVTYTIAVITYPAALAAGAQTTASLMEVWLDDEATNDFYTAVGNKYEILALSQAAQVGDWTDSETALDTAFGEVTEANLQNWLAPVAADN